MSLEDSIHKLITALETHGAALVTHATAFAAAGAKKAATKAAKETESPPPTTTTAAATTAPVTAAVTTSGVATTVEPSVVSKDDPLLAQAAELIMAIANDYADRAGALAILNKRRGSVKCSMLLSTEVQGVIDEAKNLIAQKDAAKAAESGSLV